jgi:GNAT superfamily N-acetyltransferase
MTIRKALHSDIPVLVALGQKFINGSHYKNHIPVDIAKTTQTMEAILNLPESVIFVYENQGAIVGMLGLITLFHLFSNEKTVSEVFWFVDPSRRGAGVRLLKHGQAWAKSIGAQRLVMIAPTKKVAKLYSKLSFQKLETHYIKRL